MTVVGDVADVTGAGAGAGVAGAGAACCAEAPPTVTARTAMAANANVLSMVMNLCGMIENEAASTIRTIGFACLSDRQIDHGMP